jgi:membrane-associated phospholipid phosphatase
VDTRSRDGDTDERVSRIGLDFDVDDGGTSETSSGLALAGFLWGVFIALTVLAIGPLSRFDAAFNLAPPPPSWLPVLHLLDRMGQRAVCLPILGLVIYLVYRRSGTWRRPVAVCVASVFFLNFVVGVLKVVLGRESPHTADPAFFVGGLAYPSGHTSNVILVYGLAAYLLMHYGKVGRRARVALWCGVSFLGVLMTFTSLLEHWHWFTDLLAGLLVGGAVLQMTATLDKVVPAVDLHLGWRQAAREVVSALDPRSRGPARGA